MTPILAAAALLTGVPIGVIIGIVLGAAMFRKRKGEEFDGGFSLDNDQPRAVTRIWFPGEEK